jgi:hypothetical protein
VDERRRYRTSSVGPLPSHGHFPQTHISFPTLDGGSSAAMYEYWDKPQPSGVREHGGILSDKDEKQLKDNRQNLKRT